MSKPSTYDMNTQLMRLQKAWGYVELSYCSVYKAWTCRSYDEYYGSRGSSGQSYSGEMPSMAVYRAYRTVKRLYKDKTS